MEGASEIDSGIGSVKTGLTGSETIGKPGSGNAIVGKASEGALGADWSGTFSTVVGWDFAADRSIGVPSDRQVASLPCFKPFE
jgi:PPE-repeat protein